MRRPRFNQMAVYEVAALPPAKSGRRKHTDVNKILTEIQIQIRTRARFNQMAVYEVAAVPASKKWSVQSTNTHRTNCLVLP